MKIVKLGDVIKFNKLEEVEVASWGGKVYVKSFTTTDSVYYLGFRNKWVGLHNKNIEEIDKVVEDFILFISKFIFLAPEESKDNRLIKDDHLEYFKDVILFYELVEIASMIFKISYGATPEKIQEEARKREEFQEDMLKQEMDSQLEMDLKTIKE